jgi:hypothetical protein
MEGYELIKDFISRKALLLMTHESKNSTHTGFPLCNYTHLNICERDFYCIASNTFIEIIDNDVLRYATSQYSEKFGTGNALDVVEAIYLSTEEKLPGIYKNYKNRLSDFLELISGAHCYIVEYTNAVLGDKVLRLDLFRFLQKNNVNEDNQDFVGGLFHSFKHISLAGVNLSVGNESKVEIYHPTRIINYAVKSFFFTKLVPSKKDNKFTSLVYFDDRYDLLFVYHYEKTPDVYFVDTIRKEKNH